MNIKISNIQGLIPFQVYVCNVNFEDCQLLYDDYRKTVLDFDYLGGLESIGIRILSSDGKEIKKIFSQTTIFNDCELKISLQKSDPTPGLSDGQATVLINNCYGSPTILWSNGQTTQTVSGLSGGNYSVTVYDTSKDNCFSTINFSLYENLNFDTKNLYSVAFEMLKCDNNYEIDWGFGFVEYTSIQTNPSFTYQIPYNGAIKLRTSNLNSFTEIIDSYSFGSVVLKTSELKKLTNLKKLYLDTFDLNGKYSDLPSNLTNLRTKGNMTGDVSHLPSGMTELILYKNSSISGNTDNLPKNLVNLSLEKNYLYGSVSSLPINLTSMTVSDYNSLSGSTFDLPRRLKKLSLKGSNNLNGITAGLPRELEHCEIWGQNTISGVTSLLPFGLTSLIIAGQNNLLGPLSGLPTTINSQIYITGKNKIGGMISDIPEYAKFIYLAGSGTSSNEIIMGDINELSQNVINCTILGNNEISGSFTATTSHDNLLFLEIDGANTISGNTALLPRNIQNLKIVGNNELNIFTGDSKTYWSVLSQYILKPVIAFSADSVSNLLISMATNKIKSSPPATITLKGNLNLDDQSTKESYEYLISEGFKINISPDI